VEFGSYRYGFNGQERSSEVGDNNYTAQFWEYDSRTGRRWNLDSKPVIGTSEYSVFLNSPLSICDPLGDTSRPSTRVWGAVKALGGFAEMGIGGTVGVA
jgi:hypothetical protein